jgi:major membrane immunogen (membrane-anchored lipoprotein)
MKKITAATAIVFAILTAACSEKPQSAGGVKGDSAPYTGTGKAYAQDNWKQGDKTSWESALKVRTQNGQNDYSKAN